jgi:hypothetical protein
MEEKRLPTEQEGVKKDQGMDEKKQGQQGGVQPGQEKVGQASEKKDIKR